MSEEKIIRCSICETIVTLEKGWRSQKIKSVDGLGWGDIYYSKGGWGYRQDFIRAFSGEVCNECFNALKTKILELNEILDKRKGSCKDGICIYGSSDNQSTGDKVSDMQENELQHQRHKSPILRLLSHF